MPLLGDHLECPSLARLLPALMQARRGAYDVNASPAGWRPPRGMVRLVSAWPALTELGPEHELDAVVSLSRLGESPPERALARLPRGGLLLDVAALPPPTWGDRIMPWRHRRKASALAAESARRFLAAGLMELEQWVTIDPVDVVLTVGRRGS